MYYLISILYDLYMYIGNPYAQKDFNQTPRELKELEIRSHGFSHFVFLCWCCLDTKSCPILRPHGLQGKHARLPCPSLSHVHWVGDATQPSHPLSLPSPLPSIFPSVRVFSSESALCIRWPKHWSFSFSINPSSEYSGLISFRISLQFDFLAVQGTLKILLQCHNSKASILRHSAFFAFQLTHLSMTMDERKNHSFQYVCFLIVLIIKVILITKMLILTIDEHKEKG